MDYSEDEFLLAAPENTQAAGLGSAWAVGYQLPLQIDCHIFFCCCISMDMYGKSRGRIL